jgi:hypothetical protein
VSPGRGGPLEIEESAIFFLKAPDLFFRDAFLSAGFDNWKYGTAQQDWNNDVDRFEEHIMGVKQPGADGYSSDG